MKKKYYAVKKGKVPGIYETWNEAKAQVDGFSGAVYKSFSTLEEADKYIASQNSVEEDIFDSESLNQEVEKRMRQLRLWMVVMM